jgi:hypothetical protein
MMRMEGGGDRRRSDIDAGGVGRHRLNIVARLVLRLTSVKLGLKGSAKEKKTRGTISASALVWALCSCRTMHRPRHRVFSAKRLYRSYLHPKDGCLLPQGAREAQTRQLECNSSC